MEMINSIKESEEVIIEIKKSKFVANSFYVENEKQVEKYIEEIKNKHKNARHIVYAYIIIENNNIIKKFFDDQEPNKSAGYPILNVIEKEKLTNVLIVVTRYFGGVKLGLGGLIRAYSNVTTKLLRESKLENKRSGYKLVIFCNYENKDRLTSYINLNNIKIFKEEYNEEIEVTIEISKEDLKKLGESFNREIEIKDIYFNIKEEKYI